MCVCVGRFWNPSPHTQIFPSRIRYSVEQSNFPIPALQLTLSCFQHSVIPEHTQALSRPLWEGLFSFGLTLMIFYISGKSHFCVETSALYVGDLVLLLLRLIGSVPLDEIDWFAVGCRKHVERWLSCSLPPLLSWGRIRIVIANTEGCIYFTKGCWYYGTFPHGFPQRILGIAALWGPQSHFPPILPPRTCFLLIPVDSLQQPHEVG